MNLKEENKKKKKGFLDTKKVSIFAPAIRTNLMRHYWRNGRVVECGSLENC